MFNLIHINVLVENKQIQDKTVAGWKSKNQHASNIFNL